MSQKNRCRSHNDCVDGDYCDIEVGTDKGHCTPPPAKRMLNIPPRAMWESGGGYNGCCTIQQIALYFGTYVSQAACREAAGSKSEATADTESLDEVLVGINDHQVLQSLRLKFEQWDVENQPTPQYRDYLLWVKQHLFRRSPVIITVYLAGEDDDYYDLMLPAIGFESMNMNEYQDEDLIIVNDFEILDSIAIKTRESWDDRTMLKNTACLTYCVPEMLDFGTAVTGIRDDNGVTKPVRLALDSSYEPDFTQGDPTVTLGAEIEVSGLTTDRSYVLLRYNDYNNVPTRNFVSTDADDVVSFTADGDTMTFEDKIPSDAVAVFRCVPAENTDTSSDD